MNIIFKLYYQSLGDVCDRSGDRRVPCCGLRCARSRSPEIVLVTTTAAMILAGVGVTVVGMNQWNNWRYGDHDEWFGMDGLFFLEEDPGWAGQ